MARTQNPIRPGDTIGEITVVADTGRTDSGGIVWECRCSCGKKLEFNTWHLHRKRTIPLTCGNLMCDKRYGPLVGTTVNNFHILSLNVKSVKSGSRKHGKQSVIFAKARCIFCGSERDYRLYSIVHEHIKSCGCVGLEENRQEILNKVMAAEGTILTFIRSDKPSVKNTCGVKGVSWDSRKHRWVARLKCQGVQRHHSSHIKFEDAVAARKQAEEEFYVPILEKYGMKMAGGDKECTKPP